MKIKYFLPAIAGIAMVSCTQEELFNTETVQPGEFSPITFTVNKEETDSRAWQGDENGKWATFSFSQGDLLSLWNGMEWGTGMWSSLGQNAIYEGSGVDGSLKFTTRSIVNKGTAILVYPADTAFVNAKRNDGSLMVSLPQIQDVNTKQTIPWVSDVMTIGAYDKDASSNTAGYGRNYDVLLRPVGSLFGIKLNSTKTIDFNSLGVDPIEYTDVTISNNSKLFAGNATIIQSATSSNLVNYEDYTHFTKMADVTSTLSYYSLTTSDIADDNTAYFSLLPTTEPVDAAAIENSRITIKTTYGQIVVKNNNSASETDKGPLQNTAANQGKNLAENLSNVLNSTWVVRNESKFGNEKQGQVIRRTLSLDLSTLDMDGTIVSTSKQLIDLLKVYNALGIEDNVTLYLKWNTTEDGFVLTKEAIDALNKYNVNNKITLKGYNSEFIVVLAEGATLDMLASPAVIFGSDITAILSEDATLDQTYDGSKVNAQSAAKVTKVVSNAKLTYTNTKNSSVAPSYTLEVNGKMVFEGTSFVMGQFSTTTDSNIEVAKGQTVTFKGADENKLYGNITNEGIISAASKVSNFGYIDNKFEVSVLSGAVNAEFINCGNIFNNGNLAVTYVTRNANADNSILGRIVLTNRNDNVSVSAVEKKGYIVYTLKNQDENGEYTYESQSSDVFNWLIVETESLGNIVNIKNNVQYLQIKGDAVIVNTLNTGTIVVTDLFVNSSMRLLGSNALQATNIYVEDYILHSGHLKGTQKKSYTSKVYGENIDNTTYKNGQIRTVANN